MQEAELQCDQYEFFHPFAHVPGHFEWCRIMAPSHGVFDTFIVLGESTSVPACVYVNSAMGEAFMADRYPESKCIRVGAMQLRIASENDGRTVIGTLEANAGPVREASMRLDASPTALPRGVPYGGQGEPTWGSQWTCTGVDLELDAKVQGTVVPAEGEPIVLQNRSGIVTLGSFGHLQRRTEG